ncbi:MAG TPA: extracellular solute-binding protein [Candidatus Saccharimonadales bacterium]|nr:extracellular solute-binding protein [Candidatus Saccharimonadales bacterium]
MEDSKAFTTLASQFTSATGIQVQVDQIPWANVNDKLTTAVASGNGPDVVQTGLTLLPAFESAGALLDLGPQLAAHPGLASANFLDGLSSDKLSWNGKILSVPWIADTRVLFYRTDILAKAGITAPPTTWTEFHADAAKLVASGSSKYGLYIPQWDQALPLEFAWEAGGNVVDSNGKVTFDTPAFRTAADFYLSFYKDKLVPTASDFDQLQGFISGAAPMVISGPYLAGSIKQQAPQLDGKWSVAVLPKDLSSTSSLQGSNMAVWSTSKNVDASLKFLEYLDQPATQLQWYKLTGELPTVKAALADSSMTSDPLVNVYGQQLQDANLLPLVANWNQIATDLLNSLNSIALQGADETTTLSKLNETVAGLQK